MKAPEFWNSHNHWSKLLTPLSLLYQKAGECHWRYSKPEHISVPVICIGNLTMGGAGKTPVALAIGKIFKEKSSPAIPAFFLTRGYGGERIEPLLVNPTLHTAREVGDESLLLARVLPTIVAKDRVAGARLAINSGAKAIIMDDGFQNPSLAKDLSLLVIDGQAGFGNGLVFPAGPLRELPAVGMRRANAVIIVNPGNTAIPLPEGMPVLHATTRPASDLSLLKNEPVLAFCGIGRPDKFFSMLESAGITLAERAAFPDHYHYQPKDIEPLMAKGLPLVTTAKDAVRFAPAARNKLTVIDISLEFEDRARLDTLLSPVMSRT